MLLPAFKGVVTDDQPTEIAEEGQKTDGEEKPQDCLQNMKLDLLLYHTFYTKVF
jgi:hypothetical protein